MRYIIILALLLVPAQVLAHGGGLDSNCGHHNRKTGDYHQHLGKCVPASERAAEEPTTKAPAKAASTIAPATASKVSGMVMQVKDGDTLVLKPDAGGEFVTCRLYGIDAPETGKSRKVGQPYGDDAASELKAMVLGKEITAELTGDKTYGREVCIIRAGGMNVNLYMVERGLAWAYKQYLEGPYASEYIDAEAEARKAKRGLWIQSNPEAPWEYRHRK